MLKGISMNDSENAIVVRPDILSEGYLPPHIKGRKREISDLRLGLAPAFKRRKRIKALLHSPVGTGDTLAIRHLLRDVKTHFSAQSSEYASTSDRDAVGVAFLT